MAGGSRSWYIDRNGRNSTLWPDFTCRFFASLRRFDAAEYQVVAPARVSAPLEAAGGVGVGAVP